VTRGTGLAVFEWRLGDTMQVLLNTDHTLTASDELTARRAAAAASRIE
jgi:hypothetical protein